MPQSSIRLLGPPLVETRVAPSEQGRKKAIALLAYLAVEGRPLGRDSLAALLWPECPGPRARANLRRALFDLNELLGRGALLAEQDTLRLDRDRVGVDIDAFRDLCRGDGCGARHCEERGGAEPPCAACLPRLASALELYRGSFLEGFTLGDCREFDDWQLDRETELRDEHAALLRRLAAACSRAGDAAGAIAAARRLVEENPYDQSGHRLLVRVLAAAGLWAEAERQGRDCERVLKEELGMRPDARTAALLQAVRDRDPEAVGPERAAPPAGLARSPAPRGPRPPPRPPTSFIGREREAAELADILRSGRTRILTIVGPGGIGKTRLAIETAGALARDFPGGVAFADLSPVRDPELAMPAIAAALGAGEPVGSSLRLEDFLEATLAGRDTLLVLDNFEQLLAAAPRIARLSAAAPRLSLLITSREPLHVAAELAYRLPPLGAPESGIGSAERRLGSYAAVRLFVERAAAVRPGFALDDGNAATVARLCSRLDGLPLAIELAAAHLRCLSPEELLERLSDHRLVLADGARDLPERQRTLRNTIDWSHGLLGEAERWTFARLAVFAGGFSLSAAEAVLGPIPGGGRTSPLGIIEALVDKSLLAVAESRGPARFAMLETIREYALARLEELGARRETEERHAARYLALAEAAERDFRGPAEQARILELGLEHANLRAALSFYVGRGRAREALRLGAALHWFWYRTGRFAEGRAALGEALALDPPADATAERARALHAAGWLSFVQGKWQNSKALLEESLAGFRAAGDRDGEGTALSFLGVVERWLGESATGIAHCLEGVALARGRGDPGRLAIALIWAYATTGGKRIDGTEREALEEVALVGRKRGDLWSVAHALEGLGDFNRESGAFAEAAACYEEALEAFSRLGDDWMRAWTLEGQGLALCLAGDAEGAEKRLGESLETFAALGDRGNAALVIGRLGLAALRGGRLGRAARLLGASQALRSAAARSRDEEAAAIRDEAPEELARAVEACLDAESAEWSRGRLMGFEAAMAFALDGGAAGT